MPKGGVTKGKLSVTIDKSLLDKFYSSCDANLQSYSKVVQAIIERYLEEEKGKK